MERGTPITQEEWSELARQVEDDIKDYAEKESPPQEKGSSCRTLWKSIRRLLFGRQIPAEEVNGICGGNRAKARGFDVPMTEEQEGNKAAKVSIREAADSNNKKFNRISAHCATGFSTCRKTPTQTTYSTLFQYQSLYIQV